MEIYKQSVELQMNHLIKSLKEEQLEIAFFPIKPIFANKIINAKKHFEYRKSAIRENISYIIIYSSSPEQRIIGIAKVGKVLSGAPSRIWEQTKNTGGITRKFFREYFSGKKTAYAIPIENVIILDTPLHPTVINPNFNVPQSFCYVDHSFLQKVLKEGGVKQKPVEKHKLIFVGGIHGVGKSTICNNACVNNNFIHLTASDLIKSASHNKFPFCLSSSKNVPNIQDNQKLLILALQEATSKGGAFLLDGHFVLFDTGDKIQEIPLSTFKEIMPDELIVITGDPDIIQNRLYDRDMQKYEVKTLREMQKKEVAHALTIGKKLNIKVNQVEMDNTKSFIEFLREVDSLKNIE